MGATRVASFALQISLSSVSSCVIFPRYFYFFFFFDVDLYSSNIKKILRSIRITVLLVVKWRCNLCFREDNRGG